MRRTILLAGALAIVIGAGCDPAVPSPTAPAPAPAPVTTAVTPVEVNEVRYDALDKAIAAQKKVVLVDFWATWCAPCVAKFPHFVDTHKKYAAKGLVCISVSMDPKGKDDKYDKEAVLKFLKGKDAAFPNFVLLGARDDDEKITKRFGLEAGIPFQALFAKDGTRVWCSEDWMGKKWSDEKCNEELNKLIEAELAK